MGREEQEDSNGGRHGAPCSEHWRHLSLASLVSPMLWSTSASCTEHRCLRSWFFGVPNALALGTSRCIGFQQNFCEQTLAPLQRGFVLKNLKCRHARRSVQSQCPVNY